MSGRTLRRLPVLAHSKYIRSQSKVSLEVWIEAMITTVKEEGEQLLLVNSAES